MAEQVRVAVVGTGYFGRFHADHYTRNPRARLVAVVDTDQERAKAVAGEFGEVCEARAIDFISPRYSTGANGFGSQLSWWAMPPGMKMWMHASAFGFFAGAGSAACSRM
jgi:hypothetical protein